MIAIIKNKTANFGFVAIAALMSINLWSFSLIDKKVFNSFDVIILCGFVLIILFNHQKMRNRNLIFRRNVYFFLLIPFLGCFGAYLYHDQPLFPTIFIIRSNFYWLFYFILHILKIPKKDVVRLVLFMGGVWIFITIAQQFTHQHAYFFTRAESEDDTVLRAGVYRFMPQKLQYGLFVILYCFNEYLTKLKLRNLVFVLFGLAAMYYNGARQFIAASVLCLGLAMLFANGKAKLNTITMAFAGLITLFFFRDALFGEYIKMTTGQVENSENDIRMLSANFFLNEYWPSWVTKIIGNGPDIKGGPYGDEMDAMRKYFHFFRSDVGIIGSFNLWGIFYVLNVLWANIKGIVGPYYDANNRYLRLVFFFVMMVLLINETFDSPATIPFYCFVFYLIDITYHEKEEKKTLEAVSIVNK